MNEQMPTAEERMVVGKSSAVYMYTRAKEEDAKNFPIIANTVLNRRSVKSKQQKGLYMQGC